MVVSQDKVNEYACRYLREQGWNVIQERKARHPGKETIAERPGKRLIVAPRGSGSSQVGTSRHGKTFTRSQVFNHVANAVARMMRIVSKGASATLAVPDNAHFREAIESMLPTMKKCDIGVLWVASDGTITADLP